MERLINESLINHKFTHVTNGQSFIVDMFDKTRDWSYHTTWYGHCDNERWYSEHYLKGFVKSGCWIIEKQK